MKGWILKLFFISFWIAAFTFLSACNEESMQMAAVGGSAAGKTAAEKQLEAEARSLNQITRNIIVKNTVEGAVIGAAAGCGLAVLMGGDAQDCAKGAAAGALIGGVGGNAVGRQAAQKNEQIVKTAEIVKNLSQSSQRLNRVETSLRAVLNSQNAEIRSLRRQVAAKQASKASLDARVRAINSNRRTVQSELLKSEQNVVKASNQIANARSKGQGGLATVQKATASQKARLARTRASIKPIDA